MNKLFDILKKAGFAVRSSGDNIFPAAILQGNEPVGFLLDDLSVSLVSGKDDLRSQLEAPITFAVEYQDFNAKNGEFILAEYKDTALTAYYDFTANKPAFNICRKEKDDTLTVLYSGTEREKTAIQFTQMSGLIGTDTKKINEREQAFLDAIKSIGFSVNEKVSQANRKYEISDSKGKLVGYINHSNNLTFVTDDKRIRSTLSKAFNGDIERSSLILPPFITKLKNGLRDAGMALKANFGTDEPQYTITQNNKVVATMESETAQLEYTDKANAEQMKKIDSLIKEQAQPEQAQPEQAQPEQALPEQAQPEQEIITQTNDQLTTADIAMLLSAISTIPGIREHIPEELHSKIQGFMNNTPEQAQPEQVQSEQAQPEQAQPEQALPEDEEVVLLTGTQLDVFSEFEDAAKVLEVTKTLNPENADKITAEMIAQFGTADRNVFISKLINGDYEKSAPLQTQLDNAQIKADVVNTKEPIPQFEQENQKTNKNEKEI